MNHHHKDFHAVEAAKRQYAKTCYTVPPYTAVCPRCNAAPGEPCRRRDGEQRPAHVERLDVDAPAQLVIE